MHPRLRRALALLSTLVVILSVIAVVTTVAASRAAVPATPVVFVHGYSSGSPQGLNAGGYFSVARATLAQVGVPYGQTYSVSYYRNDTNGVDVTGSGPGTRYPVVITAGHTRAGYDHTSGIAWPAHDLAWFLFDTYGTTTPVALVGHSMGGLVIRYALWRVSLGDPAFPPSLAVSRVVTIATPFDGAPLGCRDTQCLQMAPGSAWLTALRSDPDPLGVPWTALGSACDVVPGASATDVAGTAVVYSYPCYQHMGYLGDSTTLTDGKAATPTDGRRALRELAWALTQP